MREEKGDWLSAATRKMPNNFQNRFRRHFYSPPTTPKGASDSSTQSSNAKTKKKFSPQQISSSSNAWGKRLLSDPTTTWLPCRLECCKPSVSYGDLRFVFEQSARHLESETDDLIQSEDSCTESEGEMPSLEPADLPRLEAMLADEAAFRHLPISKISQNLAKYTSGSQTALTRLSLSHESKNLIKNELMHFRRTSNTDLFEHKPKTRKRADTPYNPKQRANTEEDISLGSFSSISEDNISLNFSPQQVFAPDTETVKMIKLFAELDISRYFPNFVEEEVTINDLPKLSRGSVEQLIPKIGPRTRFMEYIQTMRHPTKRKNAFDFGMFQEESDGEESSDSESEGQGKLENVGFVFPSS